MDERFFAYARERHTIHLRRAAGEPRPWTDDPVLQTSRFTNVYRELDRTTAWFRENVRGPMRDDPKVLLATVVFRWFNRTTTGEALFLQRSLEGPTAFSAFVRSGDTSVLRRAILSYCGDGPYITAAYTINTRSAGLGLTKLDGVVKLIQMWVDGHEDWLQVGQQMKRQPWSLEEFCRWARSPCLAGFMTYELACDLRHTALLKRAPDVNTWSNAGPGAIRGLNRLRGRPVGGGLHQDQAISEMRRLLDLSRSPKLWPWGHWELREVEHTLCEWDKYSRVKEGSGQTRGKFNGGEQ